MSESPPVSPRARLQSLLSIPERQRTDEEWDEINQLEITLAPGNRESAPEPGGQRNSGQRNGGGPPGHAKPGGGGPRNKNQQKKFHKKPRNNKGKPPPGSSGA
jgi:hypothetical protein